MFKKRKKESDKLISLQEATKYCPYSQEYLSLRARQRKLKALKIGRNWVTTKKWVEEYVAKAEDYKRNNNRKTKERKDFSSRLPVGEFDIFSPAKRIEAEKRWEKIRYAFVIAILLITVGGCLISSLMVLEDKDFPSKMLLFKKGILSETETKVFSNAPLEKVETIKLEKGGAFAKEIFTSTVDVFKEWWKWLKSETKRLCKKIKKVPRCVFVKTKAIFTKMIFEKKKADKLAEVKPPALKIKKGLVVVPSSGEKTDDEIKEEIKKAFSDEVKVKKIDESSGIIIPVFREKEGGKYIYVLVPIISQNSQEHK